MIAVNSVARTELIQAIFVFWIAGSLLDAVYSGIFGDFVLEALRMEHGQLTRVFFTNFPPVMWVGVLTLGGVYNAIVTHECENYSIWQSALVGVITYTWPIVLISTLIR